jgi:hypothetical protein
LNVVESATPDADLTNVRSNDSLLAITVRIADFFATRFPQIWRVCCLATRLIALMKRRRSSPCEHRDQAESSRRGTDSAVRAALRNNALGVIATVRVCVRCGQVLSRAESKNALFLAVFG